MLQPIFDNDSLLITWSCLTSLNRGTYIADADFQNPAFKLNDKEVLVIANQVLCSNAFTY